MTRRCVYCAHRPEVHSADWGGCCVSQCKCHSVDRRAFKLRRKHKRSPFALHEDVSEDEFS
jgi:hypothetical protein